ncbi:MAG TPA: hypothetical protein VFH22_01860 [Rhodocyclaceae bacterium]|nr:hypothetical protein [Rhodocyclaceae bacterium]
MRKHCQRRHYVPSAPMLVSRGLVENDVEVRERMFVQAFALGFADTSTYDQIADMRNVLTLAAAYKDDDSTLAMCEATRVAMANIRDRHTRSGKIGASGDELQLLKAFCGVYRDFWMRQPVLLYEKACAELQHLQSTGALQLPAINGSDGA